MVGYLHAKWVSYKYGFRFLYKPFPYSEEFALHEQEELWTEEKEKEFDRVILCQNEDSFLHPTSDNLLYRIPFFSDLEEDRKFHQEWLSLSIDWQDAGFRQLLRSSFSPLKSQKAAVTPHEPHYITVAVHVRRGGGADNYGAPYLWPMRFASDAYYIESLRKLSSFFPHLPIYAHIFTDDPNPKQIAVEFQNHLNDLPISFSYREQDNRHDAHVLEDFFAMMHFDCLIRSASNYTLIPSLIGNYKIVMTPKSGHWVIVEGSRVEYIIDDVNIVTVF